MSYVFGFLRHCQWVLQWMVPKTTPHMVQWSASKEREGGRCLHSGSGISVEWCFMFAGFRGRSLPGWCAHWMKEVNRWNREGRLVIFIHGQIRNYISVLCSYDYYEISTIIYRKNLFTITMSVMWSICNYLFSFFCTPDTLKISKALLASIIDIESDNIHCCSFKYLK